MAHAWVEAFLEMMAAERGAALNTLKAYARDLDHAATALAAKGTGLAEADAAAIHGYFDALGAAGASPATASRRRAALRQFYRFVLDEGWRSDDPSRLVEAPSAAGRCPSCCPAMRWRR